MSVQCYHCKSVKVDNKFQMGEYTLRQCSDCELVFFSPFPSQETLNSARLHNEHHFNEENESGLRQVKNHSYLDMLSHYATKRPQRLLEVGCQESSFLQEAQNRGFDVKGIAFNSAQIEECNQHLGEETVTQGNLEELALEGEPFDVCVLNQTLDRAADPQKLLQQIRELLKDDGVLFMTVPYFDPKHNKILESLQKDPNPDRSIFFNSQNLELFLLNAGFDSIKTTTDFQTSNLTQLQKMLKGHVSLLSYLLRLGIQAVPTSFRNKPYSLIPTGLVAICKKGQLPTASPKLSIVMPVFNEKASFLTTVENVLNKEVGIPKELIIVESNSTDGTQEEVARYQDREGVKVIFQENPQGKGNAVREGLEHVTGNIVLIQDADEEYDVNDYDVLMKPLVNNQKMFVLGSRHTGDWKMRSFEDNKLLSSLLNFAHVLFTWMINVTCDSSLKDPFTMYKVFRVEALHGLKFESNRFDLDWEIVIKFLRKKYFPIEIPVNYRSRSFSEGKKVSMIKDPLSWMWALLKFRCGKLRNH